MKFDKHNVLNMLTYIIGKVKTKDFHNVLKIMYWSEQEHLAKYGHSIYNDEFISFPKGPVASKTYSMFNSIREGFASNEILEHINIVGKYNLQALKKPDFDFMSDSEIECIDNAIKKSDNLTFDERTKLSHDVAYQKGLSQEYINKIDMAIVAGANKEVQSYISNCL